jgi:aspartate/methionine/tyrosine aminotransferase
MELQELGDVVRIPTPSGAFYMLLQLQSQLPDMQLVEALIRDYGVAVLPGGTFGVEQGCGLRLSYGALERETVMEGVGRLKHGLRNLLRK